MGSMVYFAWHELRHTVTSVRFYASIAILAAGLYSIFGGVGAYLADNELKLQITELFTLYTNSVFAQRLMLLGSLLLLADAPFIREGLSYRLLRSDKIHWYLGQLLYCAIIAAIYLLATFLLLACMTGGHVTMENTWSEPFLTLCQAADMGEVVDYELDIIISMNYTMGIPNGGSPYQMLGLAFLYAWFLVMLNCVIGMVLNLRFRTGVGMLSAVALIVLRMASIRGEIDYNNIEPGYLASVGLRDVSAGTVGYTCAYFLILITVAAVIAYRAAKRADMQRMVSE
ncbi:MAG: hypothetical protein LUE61_12010 [Clostridiales bacterium]|nr:hypothetical protein [Clostridiales bacterium]